MYYTIYLSDPARLLKLTDSAKDRRADERVFSNRLLIVIHNIYIILNGVSDMSQSVLQTSGENLYTLYKGITISKYCTQIKVILDFGHAFFRSSISNLIEL